MSGMPQEYRAEEKKTWGINLNKPRALSLHEGDPYTERLFPFLPLYSRFSHRACLQSGWRETAAGYQFYRIKIGLRVTSIRSLGAQYSRGKSSCCCLSFFVRSAPVIRVHTEKWIYFSNIIFPRLTNVPPMLLRLFLLLFIFLSLITNPKL